MNEDNIRNAIDNESYLYFETSALKNIGINEMFKKCIDITIESLEKSLEKRSMNDQILDLTENKYSSRCCSI